MESEAEEEEMTELFPTPSSRRARACATQKCRFGAPRITHTRHSFCVFITHHLREPLPHTPPKPQPGLSFPGPFPASSASAPNVWWGSEPPPPLCTPNLCEQGGGARTACSRWPRAAVLMLFGGARRMRCSLFGASSGLVTSSPATTLNPSPTPHPPAELWRLRCFNFLLVRKCFLGFR